MAASLYITPTQTPVKIPNYINTLHNKLHRSILYHPSIFSPHKFYYYAQSATTTIAALVHRHSPHTLPEYQKDRFDNDKRFRQFKRKLRPWSMEEYIDSMDDSGKRRFYQNVKLDLEQGRPITSIISPEG